MKRALTLASLLGLAVLAMAARPGTEQQLVQQLNGQPVRWVLPDGGRSGVFTVYDAGAANNSGCMSLTGATTPTGASISANVLLVVPLVPVNVCVRPSAYSTLWDGGCNTIPGDENFGVPLAVGVPQYVTPDARATSLCAVTDGGYVALPVWTVQ